MLGEIRKLFQTTKDAIEAERAKPIAVSIIGQTGTGKSTLLNTLFDTDFATDSVRPCTKDLQEHREQLGNGTSLVFYDLPGLGESSDADKSYMDKYLAAIEQSDFVIWTVHADSRSTLFDVESLNQIMNQLDDDQKRRFASQLIVVLTKADLLWPSPWIAAHDQKEFRFFPTETTKNLFEEKANYFFDQLLAPFSEFVTLETYLDQEVSSKELPEGFEVNHGSISYAGFLSEEERTQLKQDYPKLTNEFDRLCNNYRPIVCSSRFQYNLPELLRVIVERLDFGGLQRFKGFIDEYNAGIIPCNEATGSCNVMVVNKLTGQVTFSLSDYIQQIG